ncbi:uncharacterized protein LOC111941755 [Cyanistes caeruleus]|uniref:uncharacterized protein LOC111941755 n=1 Tax=Cyanistes caeruleus TaxID=156563 RepID=UPI000CDAD6A7|nr:uncharacterized protein LOC111941755 [Cyanistes caeruleus]
MVVGLSIWVLYLALYIFPHMGNYLPVVLLLLRPGNGMRIALLVYYAYGMITCEAMNTIRNIYSILFACPSLGCYIWDLLNNRTLPLVGRVESGFFQPFRSGTAVFKNIEFSLDAKDSLVLLFCFLCMACTMYTMLRNKALFGVVQRLLEEEEKRTKSRATASMTTQTATEEKGTKSKATASVSTQTATEEKETKNKATASVSTQTATEEKGTKSKTTASMSTQTTTEEKGTKRAMSTSTQTVTEPEQPKPVSCVTCGGNSPARRTSPS